MKDHKYGSELSIKLTNVPSVSEDGIILSKDAVDCIASYDIPDGPRSWILNSVFFISLKHQERILKNGSLRKKVAMRRARLHDGDKVADPFEGEIAKADFLMELEMLRIGMPKKARHAKRERPVIHLGTYTNAEGMKKDLRDLDYMNFLTELGE